jgi:acetate kinase
MDARALEHLLYHESGLLGVSGVGSDMRVLEASPEPAAAQAIDLYCYRIGRELGSLAAALGGLDAIVFTAGIGENSARVREVVCRQAAWLGLDFDANANRRNGPALHRVGSRVRAWVVPTDEEQMIARHTAELLGS